MEYDDLKRFELAREGRSESQGGLNIKDLKLIIKHIMPDIYHANMSKREVVDTFAENNWMFWNNLFEKMLEAGFQGPNQIMSLVKHIHSLKIPIKYILTTAWVTLGKPVPFIYVLDYAIKNGYDINGESVDRNTSWVEVLINRRHDAKVWRLFLDRGLKVGTEPIEYDKIKVSIIERIILAGPISVPVHKKILQLMTLFFCRGINIDIDVDKLKGFVADKYHHYLNRYKDYQEQLYQNIEISKKMCKKMSGKKKQTIKFNFPENQTLVNKRQTSKRKVSFSI